MRGVRTIGCKKQPDETTRMSKLRRSKKHACTIMISCDEPSEDGQMQVEMTCEGDEILAAFLLESARSILDKSTPTESKVSSIGN